jgi:hypothetical protein
LSRVRRYVAQRALHTTAKQPLCRHEAQALRKERR